MATAEELFTQALQLSPADRTLWLRDACGGDDALLQRVTELLKSQEQIDSQFLEAPADELNKTFITPIAEGSGTEIGPYKLREKLGEGGMGVVFVADQKEPVKRRVALKIIKPGMDSAQVVARFEAERQAVAMMDHPGIARVLDAGTTATGRPYFAMELVKGLPISKYCDEHQLSPRERLQLFVPVCHAVQHAHQKGVVHRDIKPSNILVAEYDDKPVPMIIDFGIAKALHSELTEKTVYTQYGQLIGTLEYMSPEQAKLNQLDVDTRSDVYSLGVVLYELLTGTTPLTKEQLRSVGYDEMLRMIRETDAPRPSTRLTQSKELPAISANRRSAPQKLGAVMKGELDWIVMKALEKDRTRRYGSASDFGDDVQRYLNDETVEACPPSAAYRFSKFIRRNRAIAATMALLSSAVLIAAIGASIGYFKIQQALVVERDSREEVEDSLTKVEEARIQAVTSEQAAIESERAATQALQRLKQSQDSEKQANFQNALLHANEATRAIEGLRNQEALSLHHAAATLKKLPENHPAADRLRNQIEWGLMCTPTLVHQMEIPQDVGYRRFSGTRFPFLFRGEDNRPALVRLLATGERIQFRYPRVVKTEIRPLLVHSEQLADVVVKGRFRTLFPDTARGQFITVDWQDLSSEVEVLRYWETATGKELRSAVRLEGHGKVIGILNGGTTLLTHARRDGKTVISAVADDGTAIGETEIEFILNPAVKRRNWSHDHYTIRDLSGGSFQIEYQGDGEAFNGLGNLKGGTLEIREYTGGWPGMLGRSASGQSVAAAVAVGESPTDAANLEVEGKIHFIDPSTLEEVEKDIPVLPGVGLVVLRQSEDGRVLLAGRSMKHTDDTKLNVCEMWDIDREMLLSRHEVSPDDRQVLSPDGRFLAHLRRTPTETQLVFVRVNGGDPMGVPIILPGKHVDSKFSRDGDHFLTVYETPDDDKRQILQVWKIPGLEISRPFPTSGAQRAMAFNSAGELFTCTLSGKVGPASGDAHGYFCLWNVRDQIRSRIVRCAGAGWFGMNTFGSKPDCALSVSISLQDAFQTRFHLWNMLDGKRLRPPILPSVRIAAPSGIGVTPDYVFWKTLGLRKMAFNLNTGKELPISDGMGTDATTEATLCTDDGTTHFRIHRGSVERIEFNGSEFINSDSVSFTGPGPSSMGRKFFALVGPHILFSTDRGLRPVATDSLEARPAFLSLSDRDTEIIAVDSTRNRIAAHNRAGYIAVIDANSGCPLFQRVVEPKTTWETACFNPETGDLVYRSRNGGLIYQYPVPESPESDADTLLQRVETATGIRLADTGVVSSIELEPAEVIPGEYIESNLAKAIHSYRRFRLRGAGLYADRHLQKSPNNWLALLIRGNSARVSGETTVFQNDIQQALSIAKSTDSIEQMKPWLQDMAYRVFATKTKLPDEERWSVAVDYIDLIETLPDSSSTLTMLLETAHAHATGNGYASSAAAIEARAADMGIKIDD